MSSSPSPSSSSSVQQLPSLGDSWRRFRDALSFSSVRVRGDTGTHVFHVGRYSRVDGKVCPGECIESVFRAGGRKWKLLYYPSGHDGDSSTKAVVHLGKVVVKLMLLGRWNSTATAAYRVSILDGDGKPAHSRAVGPRSYRGDGFLEEGKGFEVLATAEEQTSALRRIEDDSLVVRCDVTVLNVNQESRVKFFLRQLWNKS